MIAYVLVLAKTAIGWLTIFKLIALDGGSVQQRLSAGTSRDLSLRFKAVDKRYSLAAGIT